MTIQDKIDTLLAYFEVSNELNERNKLTTSLVKLFNEESKAQFMELLEDETEQFCMEIDMYAYIRNKLRKDLRAKLNK